MKKQLLFAAALFAATFGMNAQTEVTNMEELKSAIEAGGTVIVANDIIDFESEGDTKIEFPSTSVHVKAKEGLAARPIIGGLLQMSIDVDCESVIFEGIEFYYDTAEAESYVANKYFFQMGNNASITIGNLSIIDCEIYGYSRAGLRANKEVVNINSLNIINSSLHHIALGDPAYFVLDMKLAATPDVNIKNVAFYNNGQIYNSEWDTSSAGAKLVMDYVTILDCSTSSSTKNLIGFKADNAINFTVSNSVISNRSQDGGEARPINFNNNDSHITNSIVLPELKKNPATDERIEATITEVDYSEMAITTDPTSVEKIGSTFFSINGTVSDIGGDDTSIVENNSDKEVISTEYYDISGLRYSVAPKGLVIVKDIMSDGSVKVTKTYNK